MMGLGNRLLGDDKAGRWRSMRSRPAAADRSARSFSTVASIGLGAAAEIEDALALIAVDAARRCAARVDVVFEGRRDGRAARRAASAARMVALGDLLGAAALAGRLPARRALVAVEPASIELAHRPAGGGRGPPAPVRGRR